MGKLTHDELDTLREEFGTETFTLHEAFRTLDLSRSKFLEKFVMIPRSKYIKKVEKNGDGSDLYRVIPKGGKSED